MASIPIMNALIILSGVSLLDACMSVAPPSYVAPPPTPLNCIPCEHESENWSWGLKAVWFLIRIITHLEYSCCKVETEVTARHFKRFLQSAHNCGRRGASLRRKLKQEKLLQEQEDLNVTSSANLRIIKNGKNPFRVIAGEAAAASEIPWQVGLLRSDLTWDGCGGLLLSCDPVVVVTAAHCVVQREPKDIRIVLGAHDLSQLDNNNIKILYIESIKIHPDFQPISVHARSRDPKLFFNGVNFTAVENDIAVLKVKNPEDLTCTERHIWPACLPDKTNESTGKRGLLSGWGKTTEGGQWSPILRKVKIPIVSDEECVSNVFHHSLGLHNIFTLSPRQLCAGDIVNIKGACEGDSGSPLVVSNKAGRWSAVGLVSWRNSAASPGGGCLGDTYTIFTEIAEYLDWIALENDLLPPIVV